MAKRDYTVFAPAYEAGTSSAELARAAGINPGQMYRGLKALGLKMRGISESRTGRETKARGVLQLWHRKYDYQTMAARYVAGASINQISSEIGCGPENVRYALKTLGITRRSRGSPKGTNFQQPKGGTALTPQGYVKKRAEFHGDVHGLEHRLVAAAKLGRPLSRGEVVHHIDGDRTNNDPANLHVCSHAEHMAIHAQQRASA